MQIDLGAIRTKYSSHKQIEDFVGDKYNAGGLAIIGQDGGITTSSSVRKALMLDDENSCLFKYVSTHLAQPLRLTPRAVVAFNLIGDVFTTSINQIAKQEGYDFHELVYTLANDTYSRFTAAVLKYQPGCIITLGDPVFQFIRQMNTLQTPMPASIKSDFGRSYLIKLAGHSMKWIPCVHIRTYKVNQAVYQDQDQRLSLLAQQKQICLQ